MYPVHRVHEIAEGKSYVRNLTDLERTIEPQLLTAHTIHPPH